MEFEKIKKKENYVNAVVEQKIQIHEFMGKRRRQLGNGERHFGQIN